MSEEQWQELWRQIGEQIRAGRSTVDIWLGVRRHGVSMEQVAVRRRQLLDEPKGKSGRRG